MLRSLSIENIAVIEKCNIEFSDGFNCLTGETGAGKSIVIDAINAVTGQRTSKELVRSGCDRATVTAFFENVDTTLDDLLSEYGVFVEEDRTVLMSRTISSDGRNVCKINGVTVNVAALRDIGKELVNIHGQHDNQALLDQKNHCGYIDAFGCHNEIIATYKNCYERLKTVRKKLKALKLDSDEKEKRIELLKFQINEIDASNIKVGELEENCNRRDVLRNAEKLGELLDWCYLALTGDDETKGIIGSIEDVVQNMTSVAKLMSNSEGLTERVVAVSSEIADINAEIRGLAESVGFDSNELDMLEQRVDLIKSLCRKYGGDEDAILKYRFAAEEELQGLDDSEEIITKLQQESDELDDEITDIGAELTKARKLTSKEFSDKICDVLKYLEMPNVVFFTSIKEGMYTANGCDDIEFMISANLGQEPKPLSKFASGGELSRTMLAIKSVLSDDNGAASLIFDEIDTGISGKAADKVGRQLKALSSKKQVICVTHLAQIAAAADNHILISKSTSNGNTFTDVKVITGDDRINEIARIVSGGEMTENLYKTAKELIENH